MNGPAPDTLSRSSRPLSISACLERSFVVEYIKSPLWEFGAHGIYMDWAEFRHREGRPSMIAGSLGLYNRDVILLA